MSGLILPEGVKSSVPKTIPYAIIHGKTLDGVMHEFHIKDLHDLGHALNKVQGELLSDEPKMTNIFVEGVNESSIELCNLFNGVFNLTKGD